MNLNQKRNLIKSALLIVLVFSTISLNRELTTAQKEQNDQYNFSAYIVSVPLYIDNDVDLAGNSSSGTGDPWSPYIIENLNITTTDSIGLTIRDTTENFIVKDCYIDAGSYGMWIYQVGQNTAEIHNNTVYGNGGSGIRIIGTDYANITNNYCENNGDGINVDTCDFIVVKNNTLVDNTDGIYATWANNCSFIDNNANSNTGNGIHLNQAEDCNVTDNELSYNDLHGIYTYLDIGTLINLNVIYDNNFNGIFIQSANNDEIADNTIYSNGGVGIFIDRATNSLITDNTLTNDGFRFSMSSLADYGDLTISGNTVNGKNLGFYYQAGEIIIFSNTFGQLFLVDCDGTLAKDLTISDTDYAIHLIGCDSVIVENCNFDNNLAGGVSLENSMNCTVLSTKSSNSQSKSGIFVGGGIDTVIENCTVSQNDYGIQHVSGTNCTIIDSIITQNSYSNVFMSAGAAGNIIHNEISFAGSTGLHFMNFDYANITLNRFENNTGYAIFLDSLSTGSWIHHNAFIHNNLMGTSQAYDGTMNLNMWDDPWSMEGNYWNEWVSGNYTIDGPGMANDSYPLGSVPPGVIPEFNQFSFLIFLLPIVFVSIVVFRKRMK